MKMIKEEEEYFIIFPFQLKLDGVPEGTLMVTQEMSALQPGLCRRGHRIENVRVVGGEEGRVGGGLISAWQNLNSKRTANTLSGTDSSHLKTLVTSSLETEGAGYYIDQKRWWGCLGGGMCVCILYECM